MLTNGGDKFSKICCCYNHSLELNDIIIEHIEASKDLSRMAKEIKLSKVQGPIILSERAENIKIVVENNNLKIQEISTFQ
uniref:Uncharacterized protein n=1 Tax=Meloidogyne enterolobii TaxID=390850 RepID=A0A6V7YAG2_MELEN|nr:unnamed protein product [Meloidogyne enterolobii]